MANDNLHIMANVIGTTIVTDENGRDLSSGITVEGLLPNRLYFRINAADGQYNYIDAGKIADDISSITNSVNTKASKGYVDNIKSDLNETDNIINNNVLDLQDKLDDKVDKVVYDDFINSNECITKDDINILSADINARVKVEDLDAFQKKIISAIEDGEKSPIGRLNYVVDNHTKTIESIKASIEELRKASNELSGTSTEDKETINKQIEEIVNQLSNKLELDSLDGIIDSINAINDRIAAISNGYTLINSKFDNYASNAVVDTKINSVKTSITNIKSIIDTKADIDSLENRATKMEVENLKKKVNKLSETTDKIPALETKHVNLSKVVDTKVNKADFINEITRLDTNLCDKADIDVYGSVDKLEYNLGKLSDENKAALTQLNCNIEAVKTEVVSDTQNLIGLTTTHTNRLNNIDSQIQSLVNKDREITNTLKNEWIRIMTRDEYINLPKDPYYTDGRLNPNALQPNVIYLLMKYNKPDAIYIGSVLIAKASTEIGSTGFTYTFPIVF